MKGLPKHARTTHPGRQYTARSIARTESKMKYTRFDTLVGRYYPAVYNFASRLIDDPREAVWLTHDAFKTIRKRRWGRCNEVMLATVLLNAVILAGLKAA